jgi:hypothetical protein
MSDVPYTSFEKLNLTYKLENYPSHTSLSKLQINNAIAEAFAKWQAVSPFTFSPYTSGEPDITMRFGIIPFDSPNDPYAGTIMYNHTITFKDALTWVELFESDRPDVLSVAVHEIGHVLGLYDNDVPGSVMSAGDPNKWRTVARSPIPQVDIDKLKLVYSTYFSQYYASQGKITWWEPAGSKDYKFIHVSAGIDNTVWAIDNYKQTARELGPMDDFANTWFTRAEGLTRLAVFNEHLVLGSGIFKDPGHPRAFERPVWDFFDLKRYDRQTQSWINVSTGSLASGTKLGLVAVDPVGSVWAIAALPNSMQQIVRSEGDIIAGTGDWKVVPGPAGFDTDRTFLDLAVGRRNGEPWIWVTYIKKTIWSESNWETQNPNPVDLFSSNDLGKRWTGWITPAYFKVHSPIWKEKQRYLLAGKCVSVSDDGTVVTLFKDSAWRFDGSTWTQLPGQFIDVSVISKTNMWAAVIGMGIRSTIVTHR